MSGQCLFLACFLFLHCSAFSEIHASDCQFNLTNGNWEEFNSFASKIHNCLEEKKNSDLGLNLRNYTLPALANATFSNLGHVRCLSLKIENSQIHILAPSVPGYSIFQNSTFDSVDFSVTDSYTLVGWKWKALQNIIITSTKGFEFNAVRSKLVYLHSDFGTVAEGHVTVVRILKCGLRWLGEKVFAPLVHLRTLELNGNFLEHIKRSDLPEHAPNLKTLDLSNNRLTYLPEDIRVGLTSMELLLKGNNLKNLEHSAFLTLNKHVYSSLPNLDDKKLEEQLSNLNDTEYYDNSK